MILAPQESGFPQLEQFIRPLQAAARTVSQIPSSGRKIPGQRRYSFAWEPPFTQTFFFRILISPQHIDPPLKDRSRGNNAFPAEASFQTVTPAVFLNSLDAFPR